MLGRFLLLLFALVAIGTYGDTSSIHSLCLSISRVDKFGKSIAIQWPREAKLLMSTHQFITMKLWKCESTPNSSQQQTYQGGVNHYPIFHTPKKCLWATQGQHLTWQVKRHLSSFESAQNICLILFASLVVPTVSNAQQSCEPATARNMKNIGWMNLVWTYYTHNQKFIKKAPTTDPRAKVDFGWPKWHRMEPNGAKSESKDAKREPKGAKIKPKSINNPSKWPPKPDTSAKVHFGWPKWHPNGSKMEPKGFQNLCKIVSKIDAKIYAEKRWNNDAKMIEF